VCVAMETPSPSLIIIWGKMARGLLPRVTSLPPRSVLPPSLRLPISLPTIPLSLCLFLPFRPATLSLPYLTHLAVAAPLLLPLPPRLLPHVLLASLLSLLLLLLLLLLLFFSSAFSSCSCSPSATASSASSTSHPASPRRLIAPRHLLCPPREYYACTLPGRLCNHP